MVAKVSQVTCSHQAIAPIVARARNDQHTPGTVVREVVKALLGATDAQQGFEHSTDQSPPHGFQRAFTHMDWIVLSRSHTNLNLSAGYSDARDVATLKPASSIS